MIYFTQDKDGFYESIRIENGQFCYYLFDSPHQAFETFDSLTACETFLHAHDQSLVSISSLEEYDRFSRHVSVRSDSLYVFGEKCLQWEGDIYPGFVVMIDSGKDWIFLIQEVDLSYAWQPQQDHSYRHLGEKLVTIQDAIRKIDDMPVYIFRSSAEVLLFFKDSYPQPEIFTV
jgi:hypothetical protein